MTTSSGSRPISTSRMRSSQGSKPNALGPLILVGGVTLRLQISVSCFETLPAVGRDVHLVTYLHVREDALQLFGFTDEAERSLFENLISVSVRFTHLQAQSAVQEALQELG